MRKLLISLPDALADKLDEQVKNLKVSRSAYLRGAIERDLTRLDKLRREEAMRQGYERMGQVNLEWAHFSQQADLEALIRYEAALSDADRESLHEPEA